MRNPAMSPQYFISVEACQLTRVLDERIIKDWSQHKFSASLQACVFTRTSLLTASTYYKTLSNVASAGTVSSWKFSMVAIVISFRAQVWLGEFSHNFLRWSDTSPSSRNRITVWGRSEIKIGTYSISMKPKFPLGRWSWYVVFTKHRYGHFDLFLKYSSISAHTVFKFDSTY
jgi:hypothetical protein